MEEVRIVSSQMVGPAEPIASKPSTLSLSAYDRVMRFALYQKRILFYHPESASSIDYDSLLRSLKNSFAQALVSFYPLAARLSSSGSEIDCSNLAAKFSEAVTDARLLDLEKNGELRPSSFCDRLCEMGCSPTWPWDPNLPLLFAQVTRFGDGGISVAIAFSHHICDGVSGWHFFNSWAQVARDGRMKSPPVVSYTIEEQDMELDEVFKVAASVGYRVKTSNGSKITKFLPEKPELAVKLFKLEPQHINDLKSRSMQDGHAKFSSYEVVCAYFWRQTTLARCLDPNQEACIAVLFDSRGKFAKVPKFYFGNAIATAIVRAKVDDLVSKGVGYTASILHDTIISMDEKKNQAQLKFMENVMETGFINQIDIDPAAFSLVVSSPRHPIYDTDFGFGRPLNVTFGANDLSDGKIYLFPSATGNGIDVSVVLTQQALERLEVDLV